MPENSIILSPEQQDAYRLDAELKHNAQSVVGGIIEIGRCLKEINDQFMRGHSSKGAGNAIFSFYNDIGDSFWNLIESANIISKAFNSFDYKHFYGGNKNAQQKNP